MMPPIEVNVENNNGTICKTSKKEPEIKLQKLYIIQIKDNIKCISFSNSKNFIIIK